MVRERRRAPRFLLLTAVSAASASCGAASEDGSRDQGELTESPVYEGDAGLPADGYDLGVPESTDDDGTSGPETAPGVIPAPQPGQALEPDYGGDDVIISQPVPGMSSCPPPFPGTPALPTYPDSGLGGTAGTGVPEVTDAGLADAGLADAGEAEPDDETIDAGFPLSSYDSGFDRR